MPRSFPRSLHVLHPPHLAVILPRSLVSQKFGVRPGQPSSIWFLSLILIVNEIAGESQDVISHWVTQFSLNLAHSAPKMDDVLKRAPHSTLPVPISYFCGLVPCTSIVIPWSMAPAQHTPGQTSSARSHKDHKTWKRFRYSFSFQVPASLPGSTVSQASRITKIKFP